MATISGTRFNNTLVGTSVNDTLTGLGGDDTLLGKAGTDTAKFSGPVARYSFGTQGKYLYVHDSSGGDGWDLLSGIEALNFNGAVLAVSQYDFSVARPANSAIQQYGSAITTLADGSHVITWTAAMGDHHGDGVGIYAQRTSADGKTIGNAFVVSASETNFLSESDVAALPDGNFVITWKDRGHSFWGSDPAQYARIYDVTGKAQGAVITISATDNFGSYAGVYMDDYTANISAFSNGDFLVTGITDSKDIYAQRYDGTGMKIGGSFLVNTDTSGTQSNHAITVLENGNTASAWIYDPDDTGLPSECRVQLHAGSTPVGSFFTIPTPYATECEIASLGTGGFVVAWRALVYHEETGTQTFPAYFQRYDETGTAVGSTVQLRSDTGVGNDIKCTELEDGGFLIVGGASWARMYGADGKLIGKEIDFALHPGASPSIAARAGGGFTAVWTNTADDCLTYQTYDGEGNYLGRKITGTSAAEVLKAGNAAMLAIYGAGGDDILYGGSGNVVLHGGSGNNSLHGGSGKTLLLGGTGNDTFFSGTGNDHFDGGGYTVPGNPWHDIVTYKLASSGVTVDLQIQQAQNVGGGMGLDTFRIYTIQSLSGSHFADTLMGDVGFNYLQGDGGNDHLYGRGGEDEIRGQDGNDYLNGGVDNDLIFGGAGNDTLEGATGLDQLSGDAGNDRLVGGDKSDTFIFSPMSPGHGVDTIVDFFHAQGDKIAFTNLPWQMFNGSSVAGHFRSGADVRAKDANDYILYDAGTGKLFFDADGNGAGAATLLAIVGTTKHPTLSLDDLFVLG